ncbi:SGNH/GDSL hydrolase family protein [Streptomyces flaveolus]|uniref:SGNH/GDSL hydrolase family protein n=1 Tax=Streptomyces flaveolus TaxID=67297 RepID=UPI0037FFE8C0
MASSSVGEPRGLLPGVDIASGQRIPEDVVAKLPADTVGAGRVPAGVRLAVTGTARRLRLRLEPGSPTSVPAPTGGDGLAVWVGGELVGRRSPATGTVELDLPARDPGTVVEIYLPEDRTWRIVEVTPLAGDLAAAPRGPRWIAYGDSITQGWSVSAPGLAWPSVVARTLGLDLVNLGFAGSARGELPAAMAVARSQADVVTLAWGTNAWSSIPTDPAHIAETMRLFLTTVRQGLPDVPVVVVSPILRPDAETTPNRFGATLAQLRTAIEEAVLRFAAERGDARLTLLPGLGLVSADQLVDGVHPGDVGHAAFAEGVAAVIDKALKARL